MTTTKTFPVGSLVINFGLIAEVLEVDPLRGLLVKEVSTIGHIGCGKWYANPDMCEPYGSYRTTYADGLVVFD